MKLQGFLLPPWQILKATVRALSAHDPFRMAGATAFFTTFALPAILMIIVRTLGLFSDRRTVGRQIGRQLRAVFGDESMDSILQAIRSFRLLQHNLLLTAVIFVFLVFVATTLFKIIRNSINEIWNIRHVARGNLWGLLRSRAISVAVILLGGILFSAIQLIDTGRHLLSLYLMNNLPVSGIPVSGMLHTIVVVLVSTLWFYVLFMFLPDGRPHAKIALGGAAITAVLFNTGKWILQQLLSPGRVNNFYGASGAMVLVLLFMFYSSLILYFGAALIRAWSEAAGRPVLPNAHAIRYRTEIEEKPSF